MGIIPTFLEFLVSFVFVIERCYNFASVVEWGIDIGDYFGNTSLVSSSSIILRSGYVLSRALHVKDWVYAQVTIGQHDLTV